MDKIDIKAKIEEMVGKIKADEDLQAKFKADPVKAVEGLLGIDLPDETIQKIISGVKTKLGLDKITDGLGALGGLFGKDKDKKE